MKRKKRARHISPLMLLAPFLVDWWHNHPDGWNIWKLWWLWDMLDADERRHDDR